MAGGAWFGVALALYTATGAWGMVWGDASKLTFYALKGYIPSLNPGDHAGWTALTMGVMWLFGGDPVVVAHRVSGLAGALVVGGAVALSLLRGLPASVAHTRGALLLVAYPLWWVAGAAESYAPAMASVMMGALVAAGLRTPWRWELAGVAWGLGVAIHAWSAFLIVPLAWELAGRRAWRVLPGMVVGAAPAWLALWCAPADPLTGFAASGAATWRWHWEAFLSLSRAPRNAASIVALLGYGLGPVGLLAILRGLRPHRTSLPWWVSLWALAIALLLYAPYRLHVMSGFLLVAIVLAVLPRLPAGFRLGHGAVQIGLYLSIPAALVALGHESLGVRVVPFRNNATYFLLPVRALGSGTSQYLAEVERCAPRGAGVLADFNVGSVLRLAQECRGFRPDLTVHPVAVDQALGGARPGAMLARSIQEELEIGPVTLADTWEPYYRLDELGEMFTLSYCGPVVVVDGPGSVGGGVGP